MKFYSLTVLIEKEPEDEGYFAYSPTLPGCVSNGLTIEETRRSMFAAIQQHVASLVEREQPIPQDDDVVHVEGSDDRHTAVSRLPQGGPGAS